MKYPKYTFLAGLLCCFTSVPAVAGTVDEVTTTHNTTSTAQVLTVDGTDIQVNGTIDDMASSLPDVDVYAIDVQATDLLSFDIDCGANCGTGSVDTKLTLIDSADMSKIWQTNDDYTDPATGGPDTGSNSTADPFIGNVTLGHAGTVYVLVTYWGTNITTDASGTITAAKTDGGGQGDYQLIITGATASTTSGGTSGGTTGGTSTSGGTSGGDVPPVVEAPTTDTGDQVINVDINPFYRGRWPRINPKSRGLMPVAILSQGSLFNPMDLVVESLKFGETGTEASAVRCQRLHRDLNKDGVEDLLCFFSMRRSGFGPYSESGMLTGVLEDGTSIVGQAPLKMVPFKRRHHGHRLGGNRRR